MAAIESFGPLKEHEHFIVPEGYREDMRVALLSRVMAAPPAVRENILSDEADSSEANLYHSGG